MPKLLQIAQLGQPVIRQSVIIKIMSETEAAVIWKPCVGLSFTTPPVETGHVGAIKVKKGEEFEPTSQWVSADEAKTLYPEIVISGSSTICPDCYRVRQSDIAKPNG